MVHRTILGTWERFLGVFIEHCAGRFPPWLAPVQVRILPVTDQHAAGANGLAAELVAVDARVEVTGTEESLSKRVRTAEMDRIPYVVVVGDKEIRDGTASVRVRGTKATRSMSRAEFQGYVRERLRRREFDP